MMCRPVSMPFVQRTLRTTDRRTTWHLFHFNHTTTLTVLHGQVVIAQPQLMEWLLNLILWMKRYNGAGHPVLNNSSEGTGQNWIPSGNNANDTTVHVASYTSDGFTLTGNIANTNDASELYVGACWKSGGTSPSQTYVVKVVSDAGNKYRFDDFGTSTVAIQLQEGGSLHLRPSRQFK